VRRPSAPARRIDVGPRSPALRRLVEEYAALGAGARSHGVRGHVVLAVYTSDTSLGRGDVYVAAGLGRELVRRGFGVTLLPRDRWADPPPADLVVAMLPTFDPTRVPAGTPVVAWVRNETDAWAASPFLQVYDRVLSSSSLSLARLAERTTRTGEQPLPIGADTELFTGDARAPRLPAAVVTANMWGRHRDVHRAMADVPDDADLLWLGAAAELPARLRRWYAGKVDYFDLPEVYRRHLAVVDDLNHTTLPYGSANSRLFEGLAAGALPVTNSRLGLAELGLDDVPSYRTGDDLDAVLRELRADRERTAELTERLAAVVRARHSWFRRTDTFLELVGDLLPATARLATPVAPAPAPMVVANPRRRPRVAFFPDYRITNPYQDLLYGALAEDRVPHVPVENLRKHLRGLLREESLVGEVLHVHWTGPALQGLWGPHEAYLSLQHLKDQLDRFVELGGTLVWTVHNVLPHEIRHVTAEIEWCRYLARTAHVIHVMSSETFAAAREYYELPPERTHVIDHCSFVGVYPDWVSRSAARRRLGMRDHDIGLFAPGGIRVYKGLDRLLTVFERMSADDPRLVLMVAGKRGRYFPGQEEWERRCESNPQIVSSFEYVPDDQLQVWCRAADVAVLPYRGILNSGAFHLATTFDLPVVAPRDGAIVEQEHHEFVELFDPSSPRDLQRAVERAVQRWVRDPEPPAVRPREVAVQHPPEQMARRFRDLLRPYLFGTGPA
jgi:glycosyltransferase involved in cell wall biosynthesis